jgi:hypothetical protein
MKTMDAIEKRARQRAYAKAHYTRHREQYIERAKAWLAENKERKAAYDLARRTAKADALREYERLRRKQEHRMASKREWSRKRNMRVAQATPRWVTSEDADIMRSIYKLATIYTAAGYKAEVDHIIPLHGRRVSGLHVPSNLACVSAAENLKKRHHFELS